MILLMILLATNPCPAPHRSSNAAAKFRKLHPCPGGKDKGSIKRCSGYVIDHKCPLACCGLDAPQNMQWQTYKASKAKDKVELTCSRFCSAPSKQ